MDKKISLKCVNNGKPFMLPKMTLELHEEWLEKVAKLEKEEKKIKEKDFDKGKFDRYASKILVYDTLKKIDEKLTFEDIMKLHPYDFMKLSNTIWETGRELVEEKDFLQS